ncbi:MAG: M81 family metallopeptidase [Burkholderiaceae bacterium]|jgi:microcystin degradation protein MlrC|nr:M81 family metallopeptidase [Burkholderiales bacterium]MCZ8104838.1 M81 family metallopeptidase [Burkholderiales bacterium]MCZ8341318.1 M81 family metallopeptidase [Burkholderiaceae bacterium]
MPPRVPRIAVGGFMLESHSHAPVATAEAFAADCDLAGVALATGWRAPQPRGPATFAGFVAAMDGRDPWAALPLRHARVDASGPVEQRFFDAFLDDLCQRPSAALRLDGVYLSLHGAATATGDDDPGGTVLQRVRDVVGPAVPIVATLDLHGNVSRRMVGHADLLVAYCTNPHVDLAERGADCAAALHERLAGERFASAFVNETVHQARIVGVDAPGLTTPVLANVPWRRIPRPIFPIDPDTAWTPPRVRPARKPDARALARCV